MSKFKYVWVIVLLIFTLALVACGGDEEPTEEAVEPAEEPTAASEEPSAAADGLPDLEGREVTIAIENQYLPYNYINLETGEPAGWDYDAWAEICDLLNCVPVFVEAGWEGMIQAVADGQYDAAADGITITDRFDQVKPHPATVIERDSKLTLLRHVKALGLDLEPLHDKPGRPPAGILIVNS